MGWAVGGWTHWGGRLGDGSQWANFGDNDDDNANDDNDDNDNDNDDNDNDILFLYIYMCIIVLLFLFVIFASRGCRNRSVTATKKNMVRICVLKLKAVQQCRIARVACSWLD